MLRTKSSSFGVLGLIGMLMLITHQNCAPSNFSEADANSPAPSGSKIVDVAPEVPSPVTIIDDSKSGANLNFQFREVQVSAQALSLPLDGVCSESQEGATFGWRINDLADDGSLGAEALSGLTTCSAGTFHVEVPSGSSLECSRRYKINARLGFGQPAEAVIVKNCL